MNHVFYKPYQMKTLLFIIIAFILGPMELWASELPATFGFSGIAQFDQSTYIVVQDKKVYEDGFRLGSIKIQNDANFEYSEIVVKDWKHQDGQSNDLESICAIPGHKSEFLAAESGYREKKYGRIFHLKINEGQAEVINVYKLPLILDNNDGQEGDNFEGMACFERHSNILVIIGERGGSKAYKQGILRFGVLDYEHSKLNWSKYSNLSLPLSAPGAWQSPTSKRDISDLYLDKNGGLWAAATDDGGDEGPFRSIIYKVGIVQHESKQPVKLIKPFRASWIIDGFKVEALSGPSNKVHGSFMSFGTEDENFTGNWRPLYPPVE